MLRFNQRNIEINEGPKTAPSLSHVLKQFKWKKHKEDPVYDYYAHADHPGREISVPVRARGNRGMWYHHSPEQTEPTDPWKGRSSQFFGRGTQQLKDHLEDFHKKAMQEEYEMINESEKKKKV